MWSKIMLNPKKGDLENGFFQNIPLSPQIKARISNLLLKQPPGSYTPDHTPVAQ